VNRDCILVWLNGEWDETIHRPNKAADEEQESILRIFGDVVETLSTLELQRRERDSVANGSVPKEKENGDVMEVDSDEAVVARPTWLADVARFIKKAAPTADGERLESLSKILFQVSPIELDIDSFLAVTSRIDQLKTSAYNFTVDNVFEASLNLAPTSFDMQYKGEVLQKAVDNLRRRVMRLDGSTGIWSRKEVREYIFRGEVES
jgi:hypothetical protein